MNKQSSPLFYSLSLDERANLLMEIDEVPEPGFNLSHQKIFTAVDLWNIQRQHRGIVQRRFSI